MTWRGTRLIKPEKIMATKQPTTAQPDALMGLPRRNLTIAGVVLALFWVLAIYKVSWPLIILLAIITLAAAGVLFWAYRLSRKQKGLMSMLEGAVTSPQARKDAINKLTNDKDANDPINIFARAQLEAADDPAQGLKTIESLDLKSFPAQIQDDVCLLRAQLHMSFGRYKEALPSADRVFIENPQRKEMRGTMAAIVGEVWSRTGKAAEAVKLLETVDFNKEKEETRIQLLIARISARFATDQGVRRDLEQLAEINPNHLGRFIMPRFKVHPDLQRMAREVAEKNPQIRKMAKSQQRTNRSGSARGR
jgi:hypothetical protein